VYERLDCHLHTLYLGCANETMTIPAIVREAEKLGLDTIAITDHLNAPEFLDKHFAIKDDIASISTDVNIVFGVEVNVIDKDTGRVSIDEAQKQKLGCEVVIGGVHSSYHDHADPRSIIDLQHKLMLEVVKNPLVDVLVHPWWFPNREFESGVMAWMTDLSLLPDEYVAELGETAAACNTAIEANGTAIFTNTRYYGPAFQEDYKRYLYTLASYGAKIAIGSDAHDIRTVGACQVAGRNVREAGIRPDQLWIPGRR